MKAFSSSILAAFSLARTAFSLATYSAVSGGPSFSVGLPLDSTISSTSAGTVYFSLQAPSTYQWVGLGIGSQMSGATIFVMYSDGNGNVTISPRDGKGHVQPDFNSTRMSGVTLLEGSGISGGMMTANVKCTTCQLDSTSISTQSPWIAAWRSSGSAIDSTSESYSIQQHDYGSTRQFTFDLTTASIPSDSNPFISSTGSSNSGGASGSSSAAPTASSSSGGVSSGSSSEIPPEILNNFMRIPNYQKAHGVIMGLTVALLFPLGALAMRVVGSPVLHSLIQIISTCTLIAGFGLGVKLAQMTDLLYKSPGRAHTIFGTLITVLFLLQPLGGLLHHRLYLQTGGRTPVSHLHIWLGRAALICGIINGGLGLKLSQNTTGGEIAFGVVAGVMMLVYAVSVLVKRKGARGQKPRGEKTRRAGKWEREERMIERDAGSSRSRR